MRQRLPNLGNLLARTASAPTPHDKNRLSFSPSFPVVKTKRELRRMETKMPLNLKPKEATQLDLVSLGECMIRLSPPGHGRIEFSNTLEVWVGGGEPAASPTPSPASASAPAGPPASSTTPCQPTHPQPRPLRRRRRPAAAQRRQVRAGVGTARPPSASTSPKVGTGDPRAAITMSATAAAPPPRT